MILLDNSREIIRSPNIMNSSCLGICTTGPKRGQRCGRTIFLDSNDFCRDHKYQVNWAENRWIPYRSHSKKIEEEKFKGWKTVSSSPVARPVSNPVSSPAASPVAKPFVSPFTRPVSSLGVKKYDEKRFEEWKLENMFSPKIELPKPEKVPVSDMFTNLEKRMDKMSELLESMKEDLKVFQDTE